MKTDTSNMMAVFSRFGIPVACALVAALWLGGCGTSKSARKNDDFFTSGSREADQRATQRMAKAEQLAGGSEGDVNKAVVTEKDGAGNGDRQAILAAQAEDKLALYHRLGGEKGIQSIIDDFTPRVLQDPRVNWERKNVRGKGLSFFNKTDEDGLWSPTKHNVTLLKKHLVQFLVLATGGPAVYDGKEMRAAHDGMHITNPEFDAALGDLKASLDRLQIPNKEQKELLSIVESTRPLIVTER